MAAPADRLALSEWEEGGGDPDDLLDEEDRAARDGPAAPDLAAAELEHAADGGQLPSLDPTGATPGGDPEAEPRPAETGGWGEDMVEQVPGTATGPGAVGESEVEGGTVGGVPALESGAVGADTAPSDPARDATGGVQKIAGTDRGPAAPEDRAIRGEIEEDDAIEEDTGSARPGTGGGAGDGRPRRSWPGAQSRCGRRAGTRCPRCGRTRPARTTRAQTAPSWREEPLEAATGAVRPQPLQAAVGPGVGPGVEQAQVGPAGGQDGVDLVGGGEAAPDHGGDAGLVADQVAPADQMEAAVVGAGDGGGLAGGHLDEVAAGGGEGRAAATASPARCRPGPSR